MTSCQFLKLFQKFIARKSWESFLCTSFVQNSWMIMPQLRNDDIMESKAFYLGCKKKDVRRLYEWNKIKRIFWFSF